MRGASAVAAATRMARALNRLSKEEAPLAGVKEDHCRFHIRINDDAKSNLAPPDKATWFRLANVGLGNFGPDPALDDQDHVQVAEPWTWPSVFEGVGLNVLREVQRQVKERPRRESPQASDWIGNLIIDLLHLDRADPIARAKARRIFVQWKQNRMFKVVDMPNEKRKLCPFVVVDQPAN
jgi:hypothetical protein